MVDTPLDRRCFDLSFLARLDAIRPARLRTRTRRAGLASALVVILAILLGASAAFAQATAAATAPATATAATVGAPAGSAGLLQVRGSVLDDSGAAVAGATVVAQTRGGLARIVRTDDRGAYVLTMPAASARDAVVVTAYAPGFARAEHRLDADMPAVLDFHLEPAAIVEQVTVVSGARQAELRDSLNTRVDVVTRESMRDSGADTVGDVLREMPGVVTRRGSEGTGAAGEQIQGIDSRQVLVLMDGQPLVGARGIKRGAIDLDRQSVSRLDRVEVVKGASSTLYGSDAIGGVINLITRTAQAPFELSGLATAGNRDASTAQVNAGGRMGVWSTFVSLEHHQVASFDLTPSTFDTTGAELRRTDALGKAQGQLTDTFALGVLANGYGNRSTGRSNGELGPETDLVNDSTQSYSVNATWQAAPRLSIDARGYHGRYNEDSTGALSTGAALAPGSLRERFSKADATLGFVIDSRQFLQAGVEWTNDHYAGINRLRDDDGHSADTSVVWLQHRLGIGSRATVTSGVRYDHHSVFGTAISPKLAGQVRITDDVRARASYGRGFRAPDLGQLYYRFLNPTNLYQVLGNPDLRPEHANSWQVGTDYTPRGQRVRVGLNLFRNDVSNLIDSVNLGFVNTQAQLDALMQQENIDPAFRPQLGRLVFRYKNIANVKTQGVEADGAWAIARGLSMNAAYTYLDARDTLQDLALTGRNKHQGHAGVSWAQESWGLRASLRGTFYSAWIATRSATADVIAPRFALWDLFLAKRLVGRIDAVLAIDNLANSRDPNSGVLTPTGTAAAIYRPEFGRSIQAGVRLNWAKPSLPRNASASGSGSGSGSGSSSSASASASGSASPRSHVTGVLLLAHGGSAAWNAQVERIAADVRTTYPVEVAFGMATKASMEAAIARLLAQKVTEIAAVPLFVSSHSSVVTSTAYLLGLRAEAPADLQAFAHMNHGAAGGHADHGAGASGTTGTAGATGTTAASVPVSDPTTPIVCPVPVRMAAALDDHPLVADILSDRARALSQDAAHEVVILVAHGPNEDAENARWLENMRRLAARMSHDPAFARIEVLTVRDDADDAVRKQATADLRGTVERARRDGDRALIVPLLLSFGGIENGIRTRLDGLDYAMSTQALLPDPRLARWIIESAAAAVSAPASSQAR
jgi:outer membrane receptor for ferrienterochelin and colicins